jgi:hypothetical protein
MENREFRSRYGPWAVVAGGMTAPGFRKLTPRENEHLLRPMHPRT